MTKRSSVAYLFVAPAVTFFLLFTVAPTFMVGYLSFFKTNYVVSRFVGFSNYARLLQDRAFIQSIGNSLLFALFGLPMRLLLPLWMALRAYAYSERMRNMMRFGFYIPALTSPLVLASVWLFIFDYRRGIVSWLIGLIGLKPVVWFGSQLPAIFAMTLLLSVGGIGAAFLLFTAVLQSVPRTTIDAAWIDGASWWQIRWRVLFPIILPWVLFMTLYLLIASFQIIEIIWRMTSGGPYNSTATMLYNIYETGFVRSAYGMASAKSLVMMLVLLGIAMVKHRLEGGEDRFI